MIRISKQVAISPDEVDIKAVRSQGAGGQNVNKVSTAICLTFDIRKSTLPDFYKNRLLKRSDHRITKDGVVIIKAQQYRSQEMNREDALERLVELIRSVAVVPKRRVATKPTQSSKQKRLDAKTRRSSIKSLRGKITE